MTNKTGKKLIRLMGLILSVCLILSSCSFSGLSAVKIIKNVPERSEISVPAENSESYHSSLQKNIKGTKVASGLIELRIDDTNYSLGIWDSSSETLWSALPVISNKNEALSDCSASMISLRIAGGSDVYLLNSQDNSVAYKKASYEAIENGYKFIYDIFASAETAKAKNHSANDIGFRVELSVVLKDGSMSATCTYENITGNKNAFIENIEVMNCFGAYTETQGDNFLLVPDGCGAIINTSVYDESFESLSYSVYGDDPSLPDETSGSAIIPAFGIKRENAAFAVLIEDGSASAVIKADKSKGNNALNRVYASIGITPCVYKDNTIYISEKAETESVSFCYRFLSGVNASYAGMASAIREQLIRNSVLTTDIIEATDHLPFFLSLNGTIKSDSFFGISTNKALTDTEQAQDMLIRMKNKGISNIVVRYSSVLSGGMNQTDITRARLLSSVGGKTGLASLNEYIKSQNLDLYINVDLLSSSGRISGRKASDIFNQDASYTPENGVADAIGTDVSSRVLRCLSSISDMLIKVLTDTKDLTSSGICIDDAGQLLYSDYSKKGLLRNEASKVISESFLHLSTENKIMIDGGNFYMLRNAECIVNLPLTTYVSKSGSYTPVPFVQLILHGICDYTGPAINVGINTKDTLLKYVEYGACPHYEWNYESCMSESSSDIFFYNNTINSAADYYDDIDEILNDLRDARITDHYEIEDGVFCTEYDSGATIYVNYTDRSCDILGATVPSHSFLRVNQGG